jgi:hypothetical protein
MFTSLEFPIPGGRNAKGWKWEDLETFDRRLTKKVKAQGYQLLPDYANFRYEYLNPGVGEVFVWFEVRHGKLTFHTGTFEDCPLMQAVAEGTRVIVLHSWSSGVELLVTQRGVRRFHSRNTVQLLDGTVRGYNPQTTEIHPELATAA